MIDAILAFVVILIVILVWVNLQLFRPRPAKPDAQNVSAGVDSSEATQTQSEHHGAAADIESQAEVSSSIPAQSGRASRLSVIDPVEVVPHKTPRSNRLFDRPEFPFLLHETRVPEFGLEKWKQCFRRLTQDERVLGWIAFQGETIGASDREYEAGFMDVLRTYHRTVEKLRREVGMSTVHETSVVGEEGKVWFVTAVDDAWLALFLDNQTDPKLLTEHLLLPLLSDGK